MSSLESTQAFHEICPVQTLIEQCQDQSVSIKHLADLARGRQGVWTIKVAFSYENPKFEARNSKQIQKIHHPNRQTVRGF